MNQKELIRKKVIKSRNNADGRTVLSNSHIILKKLFQLSEFRRAKKVMFYCSFGNEVNTKEMIKKSLKLGKMVFLPKVVGNTIVPIRIKNLKKLVLGKFGILEPLFQNAVGFDPRTQEPKNPRTQERLCLFDVIIVPCVAVDKNCQRIGFGGGYFDRFLKAQKGVKIGLAHSFQIVKKIPVSKKDVQLDMVITEKREYTRMKHQRLSN